MAKKRKCNKKCRTNRAIAAVAARRAHNIVKAKRAKGKTIAWGTALKKGYHYARHGGKSGGDAHLKLRKEFKRAHHVRRNNARKRRNMKRQDLREIKRADLFNELPFA